MGNHHIDCDYCGRDTRGLSGVKGCYSQAEASKCWNYKPLAQAIEAHRAETHSGSVADESAVHAVDAPGPSQPAPAQSPSTSVAEG